MTHPNCLIINYLQNFCGLVQEVEIQILFTAITNCFVIAAFGGPIAQIALMKQELVDEEKWITQDRFNRVYGVYQVRSLL